MRIANTAIVAPIPMPPVPIPVDWRVTRDEIADQRVRAHDLHPDPRKWGLVRRGLAPGPPTGVPVPPGIQGLGLGEPTDPSCGTDPCTWWDDVYTRDACLNYLGCFNPSDWRYVAYTQGLATAVGQGAGTAAGEIVGGVVSGAVSGAGQALTPQTPTGSTVFLVTGAIALAAVLFFVMKK